MVYFMQALAGGPVKIGFSKNVEQRRTQLEAKYKQPLAVLATMPGGRAEEAEIHGRFDHLRLDGTEQFKPALELLEFIGRPLLVSSNPDAVEVMETSGKKPIASFRGTAKFAAWFDGLAAHVRLPASILIEHALIDFAAKSGYKDPPPDR